MRSRAGWLVLAAGLIVGGCGNAPGDLEACVRTVWGGLRPVAEDRARRFLGQVDEERARCRGGARAAEARRGPWVDWPALLGDRATPGAGRRGRAGAGASSRPDRRGLDGALIDLEYQRIELIKFNLFDNSGTYPDYVRGRDGARRARAPGLARDAPAAGPSRASRPWAATGAQLCRGELIRSRTLTGICNDIRNPLMGSTGMPFARNVEFEATFPELGRDRPRPEPPRRPPRPAEARPAGDQPQALHARAVGAGRHVPRGTRAARLLGRRPLRLQEGAVLQRAGRVLDPVHDPRLVLAPRRGPQRVRRPWPWAARASGSTVSSARSRPRRPRGSAAGRGPDRRGDGGAERGPAARSTHGGRDASRPRLPHAPATP